VVTLRLPHEFLSGTSRLQLSIPMRGLGPPASLEEFAGHPAYGIGQLRSDLERFVFLIGGSDGEPLFGRSPH
jgi:hypothetical protein